MAREAGQIVACLPVLPRFLLLPNLRLRLLPDSEEGFPHVGLKAGSVLKRRVEDRFHDHAFLVHGTGVLRRLHIPRLPSGIAELVGPDALGGKLRRI